MEVLVRSSNTLENLKCQLQQKLNWDVKAYRSKLEKFISVIINSVVACFNVRTINQTKIIIDNKGPPECKSSWWGQAYLAGIIFPPRLEKGQCKVQRADLTCHLIRFSSVCVENI